MAMEELDLRESRAKVLLKSETPLSDVYKEFSDRETAYMDVIRDSIESRADTVIAREKEEREALRNTPLYKYPASYAREHEELELYRASYKANVACKEAIEKAISDHYHYSDYCLDTTTAVKQVVDAFGYDRTLYVLANTIQHKDWDERISTANRRWAATIPVCENNDGFGDDRNVYFVVDRAHTGLIDLFTTQARHDYLLTIPLTKEDIKGEALKILSQFQNAREPNSPSGTHFIARVSPEFMERAKDKDRERMMGMLPFDSLALCTLDGRKGIYATINADENRFQKLRLRKPSIRAQLAAAKSEQAEKPVAKARNREEAR